MKLMMMTKEITWWVWVAIAVLLAVGVLGFSLGFVAAIMLSIAQTVVFIFKARSLRDFPVQIRIAYSLLLIVCYLPAMRWLYWLPTVGTFALILFGYCFAARVLSLMSWNRKEKLSLDLLGRTFLSPPIAGSIMQGLPSGDRLGRDCCREGRVAQL
ncbi:MAG: hypothetical protein ACYSYM_06530 [Planctomycetota bacterium]|jgi:hypothetical protein